MRVTYQNDQQKAKTGTGSGSFPCGSGQETKSDQMVLRRIRLVLGRLAGSLCLSRATAFPAGQISSLYAGSSGDAATLPFASCTKDCNGTVRALNTTTAIVNSED